MAKRQISKTIVPFAFLFMVVSFQNCSEVQFGKVPEASFEKAEAVPFDESGDDVINEDGYQDPVVAETECAALRDEKLADQRAFDIEGEDVKLHHVRGSRRVSAQKLSVIDTRGHLLAEAEEVSEITNARGSLCLSGSEVNALSTGAKIVDHRGRIEIANFKFELIQNTRGHLVIRGGEVAEIIDHRGKITLIDVKVGRIQNTRGKVELLGTSTVTEQSDVTE